MIDRLARQWLTDDRLAVDHAAELRHRLAQSAYMYHASHRGRGFGYGRGFGLPSATDCEEVRRLMSV